MMKSYNIDSYYTGKIFLQRENKKISMQRGCSIAEKLESGEFSIIRTSIDIERYVEKGRLFFVEDYPLSYSLTEKEKQLPITDETIDRVFQRRNKVEKEKTKIFTKKRSSIEH